MLTYEYRYKVSLLELFILPSIRSANHCTAAVVYHVAVGTGCGSVRAAAGGSALLLCGAHLRVLRVQAAEQEKDDR